MRHRDTKLQDAIKRFSVCKAIQVAINIITRNQQSLSSLVIPIYYCRSLFYYEGTTVKTTVHLLITTNLKTWYDSETKSSSLIIAINAGEEGAMSQSWYCFSTKFSLSCSSSVRFRTMSDIQHATFVSSACDYTFDKQGIVFIKNFEKISYHSGQNHLHQVLNT